MAAVRVVARGDALLAPSVTRRLLADFVRARPAGDAERTPARRHRRADRTGTRDAGAAGPRPVQRRDRRRSWSSAEHTVKTHVGNVLMKLGLRDRIHAVIWAYEHGVVAPGG